MNNNQMPINNSKGTIEAHWKVWSKAGKYKIVIPGGKAYKQKVDPTMLICKNVEFCSYIDEYAFFKWIEANPSIESFSQVNDELYLHIACLDLHDHDLGDLLALFYRYKIEMTQLAVFLNDSNKHWFYENKKAYWYKKVFKVA